MPEDGKASLFRDAVDGNRVTDLSGEPLEVSNGRSARYMARTLIKVARSYAGSVHTLVFARTSQRLRHFPQLESGDCGAACLATVSDYHGIAVAPAVLREKTLMGRSGTSARLILSAARDAGFVARGVKLEPTDLHLLPPASILHWNLDHFVVLERVTSRGAWVVDPALGRRHVSAEVLDKSFTGVALVVEGSPADASAEPGEGGWRRIWPLLRERRLWAWIAVTALFSQALALAFPFLIRYVIDTVIANETVDLLQLFALMAVPLLIMQTLVLGSRAVSLAWLRGRLDYRLTLTILDRLFTLPYPFFEGRATGDLMMRIRSTAALRQIFTTSVLSALVDGVAALTLLVVLTMLNLPLALATIAVIVVQCAVVAGAWRSQQELTAVGLETQAASQARLVQMLAGAETLKVAGAEADAVGNWAQLLSTEINSEVRRSISAGTTEALLHSLRLVAPLGILLLGAYQVLDGRVGTGTMVAATTLSLGIYTPVTAMLNNVFQLASLRGYLARIDDILQQRGETDSGDAAAVEAGAVRLDRVVFSYPGAAAPVLRGLDLTVEPGTVVSVMGGSGSGKSTAAKLIAGLYRPDDGDVYVDGRPVSQASLRRLRQQIGFVPQQPHFFSSSILDNITLFRDYSLDDVRRAARAAYVDHVVEALPFGYDTLLSEHGESLSGGERQRLGLARALLMQPKILVLDEATSALDQDVEDEVLTRVLALGVTTILITHRESVASRADRVVVLRDGRFAERAPGSAAQ